MKKHLTKKSVLAIVALILCLSVSIGAAMAYFTDYEDAYGGAMLHLGGETQIDEGGSKNEKNITIKNTGETNMIVRVGIFGDEKYLNVSYDSADWAEQDGFYYYKKVLNAGQATSLIHADVNAAWEGSEKPDIDLEVAVVHESVQALYENNKLQIPDGWYAGVEEVKEEAAS